MRKTLAHQRYFDIQRMAKRRGIDFDFTFEEWCWWWEKHLGHNWLKQRMCNAANPNGFVMARIGDKGPYKWDNVKCITNKMNSHEIHSNKLKE